MSLVDIGNPFFWGRTAWHRGGLAAPVESNLVIDATGEKVAYVVKAPATGDLSKVRFRIGGVTGAEDLRVSFQDLDASGDPDGTADQFRVVPAASVATGFVQTGIVSSDGTDGGTKRSVVRGDRLAVVIEFAGTAGNILITTHTTTALDLQADAYPDHFTSSWTKQQTAAAMMSLEYADGSVYPIIGVLPGIFGNETFNSSDTPDERGNNFTLPFAARIVGIWSWLDYDNAVDLVLYSGTDVLATKAAPAAAIRSVATAGCVAVYFDSDVEVSAEEEFRAIVKPGAGNVGLSTCALGHATERAAYFREDFYSTSRTNAGAFSEDTAKVYQVGPILDAIDVGGVGVGFDAMRYGHRYRDSWVYV